MKLVSPIFPGLPASGCLGRIPHASYLVQQNHLVRRDDLVHLGYQTGIGEGASSRVPDPPLLLHFTPNPPSPRPTDYDARVGRRPKPRRDDLHQAPRPVRRCRVSNRTTWPRDFAHMFFTGKEGGCNWMGEETAEDVSVFWQCSLHLMYVLLDSIWLNPEQHLLFETMLI